MLSKATLQTSPAKKKKVTVNDVSVKTKRSKNAEPMTQAEHNLISGSDGNDDADNDDVSDDDSEEIDDEGLDGWSAENTDDDNDDDDYDCY